MDKKDPILNFDVESQKMKKDPRYFLKKKKIKDIVNNADKMENNIYVGCDS